MNTSIAKFEKVPYDQFKKDWVKTFGSEVSDILLKPLYDNIELPKRSTKGSAGYDFKSPVRFALMPGESIMIPSGIRCSINEGWVLCLYPKSGLGCKYRLAMPNTIPVIDSDYYGSDNYGHIMIELVYDGVPNTDIVFPVPEKGIWLTLEPEDTDSYKEEPLLIEQGQKFVQGIFLIHGITENDDVTEIRNGGFGSTGA